MNHKNNYHQKRLSRKEIEDGMRSWLTIFLVLVVIILFVIKFIIGEY